VADLGINQKGPSQGVWGWKAASGVQGQSPGRVSGERSHQQLKQNVKLVYNF